MDAMGANDTPDAAATGVLLDAPRTALSTNAGGYYCGHVFFLLQRRARLSRTAAGQVRAGFLHVPREPNGSERRPAPERFAALRRVLDAALVGAAEEMTAAGVSPRLLVTGFGAFLDVANNITGAFTSDRASTAALQQAHPSLVLGFATLPVDDRCLDPAHGASIERAVAAHEATAVIALGVARSREDFTVESVPDDSGLEHEGALRHAGGRAIRCRGPASSWLADCVRRGARR
jgi:pyrrolidone-carboxylate peptidase